MKAILPYIVAIVCLCAGCSTPPSRPPDPLARAILGLSQLPRANKQAAAIRADTATLFPSRSQAVSLGLLHFQQQKARWPTTPEELRIHLVAAYPEAAPPAKEFADLTFYSSMETDIIFGFRRAGLPDETYRLSSDGEVRFSLQPQIADSLAASALTAAPPDTSTPDAPPVPAEKAYDWGEVAGLIFLDILKAVIQDQASLHR